MAQCLYWLRYADRYELRQWKVECMHAITAHRNVANKSEAYKREKKKWAKALREEVKAALRRQQ